VGHNVSSTPALIWSHSKARAKELHLADAKARAKELHLADAKTSMFLNTVYFAQTAH
jgi:hypothetical protein